MDPEKTDSQDRSNHFALRSLSMTALTIILMGPDCAERAGLQQWLHKSGIKCILVENEITFSFIQNWQQAETLLFMELPPPQFQLPSSPSSTLPVLVWGAVDEPFHAAHWIRAGAMGYILRTDPIESLLEALQCVAHHQPWLSPRIGAEIARHCMKPLIISDMVFTPRERQVLRLLMAGLTNTEIGRELDISERTVRMHLRNAYDKMGVNHRVEAIKWLLRHQDSLVDNQ